MLTTGEARARILAAIKPLPATTVPLADATGRVLAEAAVAERDQPPFDRVTMDGIALRHADYATLTRSFPIQGSQFAGDPALSLEPGHCIEIMTGAALPENADLVIPVERITVNDGAAHVEANYAVRERQFIHARASDYHAGKELLQRGTRIRPMEVAVLASCGLAEVSVAREPAVTVISTGDELVQAGKPIAPEQIRMSNGPAVVAMLREHGYSNSSHDHLPDDKETLRERIAMHLDRSDVLILSGGVSRGKADYVPEILADLGVSVNFHRISQRPGKPMWFGTGPAGQTVFALPGNPVSTLVCCRQYVIPALDKASGETPPPPQFANLSEDISFKPNLTYFVPVRIVTSAAGHSVAMPVRTNTSGDFAALAGTTGYVELAMSQSLFRAGTTLPLTRW